MTTSDKEQEKALVVYQKTELEVANAVQKVIPLREIQPENIIVTSGGLYCSAATNLKIGDYGLQGFLSLAFYREINKEGKEDAPRSLSELVIAKFFGKSRKEPDRVHEGKEYQRVWRLWSSDGDRPHYLLWNGCGGVRIDKEALEKMKAQLLQKHDLLFSNEFLCTLYSPILRALLALYDEIARY